MKILIVMSYFGPTVTGALNFIKILSEELIKRGHKISIAIDDRYKSIYKIDNVDFHWFKSYPITNYSPSIEFRNILKKIDADVIHLNGYMSFQIDFGSAIASKKKIPTIITPHGSLLGYDHLSNSFSEKIPYILHEILSRKISIKNAKYVIVTSISEYQDAVDFGIDSKKIITIPLCFQKPIITQKNLEKKSKKLLFVGRLVPNKNIHVIFQALSIVIKKIPDVELILVGDALKGRVIGDSKYEEKLNDLVTSLNLSKNVCFVGWQKDEELWKFYLESNLMLSASEYENFSMPLLEAATFGLPLISTDVGVAKDLIENDKGGKLIKKGDHLDMANAIVDYLTNNEKYSSSQKFISKQSELFTPSFVAQKYEELFLKLLSTEK